MVSHTSLGVGFISGYSIYRFITHIKTPGMEFLPKWSFPRSEKCFRDRDRDRVRENGFHVRDGTVLHGPGPGPGPGQGSGCPWSGPWSNGFQTHCFRDRIRDTHFQLDPEGSRKHFSDSVKPPPSRIRFRKDFPDPDPDRGNDHYESFSQMIFLAFITSSHLILIKTIEKYS